MKYIIIALLLFGCKKDGHNITFKFQTYGDGAIMVNNQMSDVSSLSSPTKFEFQANGKKKYTIKASNKNRADFVCMQYYVYLNDVQIDNGNFKCYTNEEIVITNKY